MPLTYKSILRRADTMDPKRIDGIVKSALDKGVEIGDTMIGGNLVARALHPGDLPPTSTTQRLWLETTGATTDQFISAARGDGTVIRADTVIVVYGCRWVFSERANANAVRSPFRPPVSAVRFVVGGTRVAEWDLNTIFVAVATEGPASSQGSSYAATWHTPVGIGESPIIIKPRTTLLIQYYELTTAATDFSIQLLGHVIEPTGGTDGLNP